MTTLSVVGGGRLRVDVLGWHRLWCFRRRLEFPLAHVVAVRPGVAVARAGAPWLRSPGTHLPGVITAGTCRTVGTVPHRVEFWDVCDADRAVVVDLRNEHLTRLVVEVANPVETVARFAPVGVPA